MAAAKPDCTGERFGMLTVLGKGGKALYKKANGKTSACYLWRLQCDCGKIIELKRGDFDRVGGNHQVSCGCKRKRGLVENNRRPHNIAGQRFDKLTAIALTGKKDKNGKPTWTLCCDCGGSRELSLSSIRMRQYYGNRINCGDRSCHRDKWLEYPEAPIPYPQDAADIALKHWHLTESNYQQNDSAVEDKKRDNLLRASWIVAYRRRQGEEISELYECRYIPHSADVAQIINIFEKFQPEKFYLPVFSG